MSQGFLVMMVGFVLVIGSILIHASHENMKDIVFLIFAAGGLLIFVVGELMMMEAI